MATVPKGPGFSRRQIVAIILLIAVSVAGLSVAVEVTMPTSVLPAGTFEVIACPNTVGYSNKLSWTTDGGLQGRGIAYNQPHCGYGVFTDANKADFWDQVNSTQAIVCKTSPFGVEPIICVASSVRETLLNLPDNMTVHVPSEGFVLWSGNGSRLACSAQVDLAPYSIQHTNQYANCYTQNDL